MATHKQTHIHFHRKPISCEYYNVICAYSSVHSSLWYNTKNGKWKLNGSAALSRSLFFSCFFRFVSPEKWLECWIFEISWLFSSSRCRCCCCCCWLLLVLPLPHWTRDCVPSSKDTTYDYDFMLSVNGTHTDTDRQQCNYLIQLTYSSAMQFSCNSTSKSVNAQFDIYSNLSSFIYFMNPNETSVFVRMRWCICVICLFAQIFRFHKRANVQIVCISCRKH